MKLVNCSLDEFADAIGEKKIYCFGYGVVARLFLDILYDSGLEEKIKAFVDNNQSKVGSMINYEDIKCPIISLNELSSNIAGNCILITCSDIVGVCQQLNEIKELDEINCYSMHLMLSRQHAKSDFTGVIRRESRPFIPKKIHYCWFGKNPIPDEYKKWMESWEKFCPDYEIIEWNEDNYDYKKNQYMYDAYRQKKWGFVADCARLDIIYEQGGIYLDTDVEIVKGLDDLLYQQAFSVFDVQFHVNLGNGFGAAPKHPLIKELKEYYDNISFIDENGKCDLTTCVTHQHNVLRRYGLKANGQYQVIREMAVYPATINGIDAYSHLKRTDANTIFMHYGTASWSTPVLAEARKNRIQFLRDILKE